MNQLETLARPGAMPMRLSARPAVDSLDRITSAESLVSLFQGAEAAARHLGFEHFLYCARFAVTERAPRFLVESNEPLEWVELYRREELWRRDPRYAYCMQRVAPTVWDWDGLPEQDRGMVRRLATTHGIEGGLIIPLRCSEGGCAMLCFDTGAPFLLPTDREGLFALMGQALCYAAFLHEQVERVLLEKARPAASRPKLSAREREVLQWLSRGKGAWEVAQIMGIAESTVYFHLRSLKRKLDVSNIAHAVARAIAMGIVAP